MKRFSVTVNGKAYDVAVEEITDGSVPVVAAAPAAPAPVAAAPAPAAAPAAPAAAGEGETVTAPMPGTILDVKVNVGDTVSKGQVIMILEAMKMENEIMAARTIEVTDRAAKKNDTVNSGDTLATVQ